MDGYEDDLIGFVLVVAQFSVDWYHFIGYILLVRITDIGQVAWGMNC